MSATCAIGRRQYRARDDPLVGFTILTAPAARALQEMVSAANVCDTLAASMTSRIERGITIEGSIRGEGELEVAGRVRGALTLAGKLIVEPGGIVEADVEATDIEVRGLLAGSATAHNTVQVCEGGRVEARIKANRLMVDDGALFRGELMAQGSSASAPAIGLAPASVPSRGELPAPRETPSRERGETRAREEAPARRERGDRGDRGERRERAEGGRRERNDNDRLERNDSDRRERGEGERRERSGPRGPAPFRAPDAPPSAQAKTEPRAPEPRAPQAGEPVVMPMLPRGRTKIRMRGGES